MRILLLVLVLATLFVVFTEKDIGGNFLASLNPFNNSATSTVTKTSSISDGFLDVKETPQPPSLSNEEIEKEVDKILEDLNDLEESLREAELHDSVSPYADMVTLSAGNAKTTDPDKEYLIITANSSNQNAVAISDWYVESFVTDRDAEISEGARTLVKRTSRNDAPIDLLPGEKSYLITGTSPGFISFRENECTGYLSEYKSYYPSLKKSCPLPGDELLQFGDIKNSDDECFEFIEGLNKCEITDSVELDDANISNDCEDFVEEVLDYEGCVDKHRDDATFFDVGSWRIYLEENRELWRSTREIIRLMDGDDLVVDVVEY